MLRLEPVRELFGGVEHGRPAQRSREALSGSETLIAGRLFPDGAGNLLGISVCPARSSGSHVRRHGLGGWGVPDAMTHELQQVMFMKSQAMIGGALFLSYFGGRLGFLALSHLEPRVSAPGV
jgi:hypothetical protein